MRLGKYLSSLTKPELELLKEQLNLSDDEIEVFNMLSKSKSITSISIKMCVSERTISRISERINKKLEKV